MFNFLLIRPLEFNKINSALLKCCCVLSVNIDICYSFNMFGVVHLERNLMAEMHF